MKRLITFVIVDLYCGAGGMSEGAKAATDRLQAENPDCFIEVEHYAINHWGVAIKTHTLNHPHAVQICERIEALRPSEVVKGGKVHLLIAAPECIYHSRARGSKPVNDQRRAGAWTLHNWLTELDVDALLVENVKEFREWGPLDPATKRPDKKRRGAIFQAWLRAIQDMGYITQHNILCCADHGDPTTRERFFLMARKDGKVFDFPKPTHASPAKLAKMAGDPNNGGLFRSDTLPKPWLTARDNVIDWELKGKSIFEREALGMKALVENTLMRIDAGLCKFNGPEALPFVVALRHFMGTMPGIQPEIGPPPPPIEMKGGSCQVESIMVALRQHMDGVDVDGPLPTMCAGGTHFAIVEPVIVGRGGPQYSGKPRSMDAPMGTLMCENHQAVAEPALVQFNGTSGPQSIHDPVGTIPTHDRFGVAEPYLLPHPRPSEGNRTESVDDPMRTITAGSADHFLAEPVVLQHRLHDKSVVDSVDVPMRTIRANGGTIQVVEPALVNMKGESDASSIDGPTPTQTTNYHLYLAEPFLAPHQTFGEVGTDSVDAPVRTIRANNGKDNAFVEPVIVPQFSESNALPVGETLGTLTTTSRGVGMAEPFITPGFGEREGQAHRVHSVELPLPTIAAGGHLHVCQAFLIDVNHGNGDEDAAKASARRSHGLEEPLGTVTAARRGIAIVVPVLIKAEGRPPRPGYQLITEEGTFYIEILFRMLQPHELAAAHSFPVDYRFHGTKGDIVKQIGNSVPVSTATALCYEQLAPCLETQLQAVAA